MVGMLVPVLPALVAEPTLPIAELSEPPPIVPMAEPLKPLPSVESPTPLPIVPMADGPVPPAAGELAIPLVPGLLLPTGGALPAGPAAYVEVQ